MVRVIATCKSKKTSCDNCGSCLGYWPVDVKKERRRNYVGDWHIYKYIV